MGIELILAAALLIAMLFLATVDMAFSHISDVGLRRISSDDELADKKRSVSFLREILDNRPRESSCFYCRPFARSTPSCPSLSIP
jgi:hypothetical protein